MNCAVCAVVGSESDCDIDSRTGPEFMPLIPLET